MKKVKDFNEFTSIPLTDNKSEEKLSVNKYQHKLQKFYKDSGYFLYYASTFNTATLVLIPIIKSLFDCSIEESIMLTVFSIAILTREGKDKVEKLHVYLHEHGIADKDIEKTITVLTNIYELFKAITKVSGKEIEKFADMLSDTGLIVPYISVINNMIDNGFLNLDLLSKTLQEIKDELGDDRFKLLIHRILHKLNIITTNNHKFQNKDNVKPLKVNDELKGPMVYTEDVILEKKWDLEKMTTDVKSKVEKSKKLSKEMKEKILPLIKISGIHGTKYNKGVVTYLKLPKVPGKSFGGVGLGADKNGFFVMTHRARSKSYPELDKIPNKDINFVKSTG